MHKTSVPRKLGWIIVVLAVALLLPFVNVYGQIWEPDERLTNDPAESYTYPQSIAVVDDSIHVVWADDRDGNEFKLFYKSSIDNGEIWRNDSLLAFVPNVDFPAVAVSGNDVHVIWIDDQYGNSEISYKRSTDNGVTWETDVRLTSDDSASIDPRIAVNGNFVHIVWSDTRDTNSEIYYERSVNSGSNWGVERRSTVSDSQSVYPAIAVSGNTVHLVWVDDRDGNPEIYYTRSTNNGDDWEAETRLTNADSISSLPVIAASEDFVHVLWQDKRDGELELYYKQSTNNGAAWGADTALTDDGFAAAGDLEPSIALAGEDVHIVWNDFLDGNAEIYYKRSVDNGVTWENQQRLTSQNAASYAPSIAVWDYNIHVLWTDEREANPEVYYKHGVSGELQPDNLIKNDYETFYIGDGIYNNDGTNQVEERTVRAGNTAIFNVRIENDGDIPEEIMVGGTVGDSGWLVTYYDALTGGTDITTLVEYYIWPTGELKPDSFVEIRVEVMPDVTIPEDSSYAILVTSVSTYDTTRLDVVKAVTTVSETEVEEDIRQIPAAYALKVSFDAKQPVIRYAIPQTGTVTIVISDVTGRMVKTLVSAQQAAGSYLLSWDACDDRGTRMPTGVYFCQLVSDERSIARKFILVQ